MATPFYVSPEQVMKDRADYARKGISRGRSLLAMTYADGILFVTENPSRALHKVSELYDRIAFAAVGKYNEFENLRVAGVRLADMRGYAYDRRDVTGRGLANAYAQTLGSIFIEAQKPYEVEIVVAEIGAGPDDDQIYRLTYDGSVADESGFVAMGGQPEAALAVLRERHRAGLSLVEAMDVAVSALSGNGEEQRTLAAAQLEVAVLDRTRLRRTFRRIVNGQLAALMPAGDRPADEAAKGVAADDAAADAAAASGPGGAAAVLSARTDQAEEQPVGGDQGDGPDATT